MKKIVLALLCALVCVALVVPSFAAGYGFVIQGQTSGYNQFQSGGFGTQTSGAAGVQSYNVTARSGGFFGTSGNMTATNGYAGSQTSFTGPFGGFQTGSGSALQGGGIYVK